MKVSVRKYYDTIVILQNLPCSAVAKTIYLVGIIVLATADLNS